MSKFSIKKHDVIKDLNTTKRANTPNAEYDESVELSEKDLELFLNFELPLDVIDDGNDSKKSQHTPIKRNAGFHISASVKDDFY